jgi:hypothetical protein
MLRSATTSVRWPKGLSLSTERRSLRKVKTGALDA